jgi:hypothetical protein
MQQTSNAVARMAIAARRGTSAAPIIAFSEDSGETWSEFAGPSGSVVTTALAAIVREA